METRSSSRGWHNKSKSRASLSRSQNNIYIETKKLPRSSKPSVVETPKDNRQKTKDINIGPQISKSNLNPITQFFDQNSSTTSSLNTVPQYTQNSQIMDNEDDVNTRLFVPLSSIQNDNIELPSVSNVQNQSSNQSVTNANAGVSLDSLITLMEQTMRNTTDEFRRELCSLRESISQIGISHPSGSNRVPIFSNSPQTNAGNSDRNINPQNTNRFPDFQVQSSLGTESNVKLEKWKISYDGSGSVSDFLFKVDTLRTRSKCCDDHLLSNFHILLDGKAEKWYWLFTKQNQNVSYATLRRALTREFGHLESDHDILLKISLRKQQYKETYDDFHTAISSMNSRLQTPLPDATLIDIIKRNVSSNLRFLLFNSDSNCLNDFRDIARRAEKVLKDNKFQAPNVTPTRHVNGLETSVVENNDLEDTDPQLEAVQLHKKRNQYDYSQIQCWNCMSFGHSYIYCPEEIHKPFCFKCGQKGVLTPKCPNKHGPLKQGNLKTGEMATGDTRPVHSAPSLI